MAYEILEATTMYSITSFGIICSFISLYCLKKQSMLHNAFGLICAVHSVIESFILVYTILVFSIVFFNPDSERTSFVIFMGFLATSCHTASIYLQVIKSLNRSFAIIFPIQYRITFTPRKTMAFLAISSGFCIIHVGLYLSYSCHYFYSNIFYTWILNRSDCEQNPGSIINLGTQIFLVVLTLSGDAVTLCLLQKRRMKQTLPATGSREIRFFFQTCLTSLLHAGMLISPRLLKPLTSNLFLQFLAGTPSMMLFHALNEFLFVIFIRHSSKTTNHPSSISPAAQNP